ncbi:MAG: alpha/beta hydrolase [Acidimicrobiales bacterium]
MVVPVDYRHPTAASLSLAVTRAPATGTGPSQGTLVFNPGGPGESGNQILPVVIGLVPPAVRRSFDIVSFDPRGTGNSQPLDCGTSPAAAASVVPVPAAGGRPLPGTPVYAAMARACLQRAPELAPFVDTVDTARDLDRIRQALGLSKLDYYGLSYGTVLGAVYADLFPHRVGRFVLDGAVDVGASLTTQAEQEAPAAEQSLDHLLATCASAPACPLGDDPQSFYRSLSSTLARHPLPAPGQGDDHPVTVGDLDTAALLTISVPSFTSSFYAALVAAHGGDGAPLRNLALELETDVDGAPLVDPLWAITCNDTAVHPGPVAAGDQARALAAKYPLIGGYAVDYTMGGCVSWPAGRQPVSGIHPEGVPPVLVIGNTGDPNTPIVGARHLAALLPGSRLLTWQGWGHTWLLSGATDRCMQQSVSTYFVAGGGLPAPHTVCG